MFGIGAQELIVILVIALLVFGPKRLPELARSLGRGLAEFRRASSDLRQSLSVDSEPQGRREDSDQPGGTRGAGGTGAAPGKGGTAGEGEPGRLEAGRREEPGPAQTGGPEPEREPAPASDEARRTAGTEPPGGPEGTRG